MKKTTIAYVLAVAMTVLIFVIALTWVSGKVFGLLEPFASSSFDQIPTKEKILLDTSSNYQRPYVTSEMDQPDYEGNFSGGMDQLYLDKYEGGIGPTRDAMNTVLRQFPFDWSNAPPGARVFQEQNALYLEKENQVRNAQVLPEPFMTTTDLNVARLLPAPAPAVNLSNQEGFADAKPSVPPEDKVLKAYKPILPSELGKMAPEDAELFIQQYYDKKGLVPEIEKSPEHDNVFHILSLQDKNPKIVWEDEVNKPKRSAWTPIGQSFEFDASVRYGGNGYRPEVAGAPPQMKTGLQKEEKIAQLERIFGPGLQWQQWG